VKRKETEVYNPQAHVRIPNWLTFYDSSSTGNLTNGIHALPILQTGKLLWDGCLGKPVSFGCIVMNAADSEYLYQWADIGTPVAIHGVTPPSLLQYDNLAEAQMTNGSTSGDK
jgi:lipoprotein-anchoring transpeptidase ErfK/SrfK